MAFSKQFVWNMTQYEKVLWLDSDTLVVQSLTNVFKQAEDLFSPKDLRPGPRIGMVYGCKYYRHYDKTGLWPAAGSPEEYMNSGVMLLKPGSYGFTIKSQIMTLNTSIAIFVCVFI